VFTAFILTLFILSLQIRLKIGIQSIDPAHEDSMGGYEEVVKGFTKILELLVFGLGVFFMSFYYLFNFYIITIAVALGVVTLFGVYFIVMYEIHTVLEKAKRSALNPVKEQIEELEKEVRNAIKQKDLNQALLSWIELQSLKESSSSNRIKNLKTWPLSIPILSRISLIAIVSFWLQIAIEFILSNWLR